MRQKLWRIIEEDCGNSKKGLGRPYCLVLFSQSQLCSHLTPFEVGCLLRSSSVVCIKSSRVVSVLPRSFIASGDVMPYALGARSHRLANQRATRGATVVQPVSLT